MVIRCGVRTFLVNRRRYLNCTRVFAGWSVHDNLRRLLRDLIYRFSTGCFRNDRRRLVVRYVFLPSVLPSLEKFTPPIIRSHETRLKRAILGLGNFLNDVEFMLKRRLSIFWRICWSVLTPGIILVIFIYTFANLELLKYNKNFYPNLAYGKLLKLEISIFKKFFDFFYL